MYAAVVGNDRFLSIGKNISIMIHWSTGRQRQRHILTSRPLPVSVIDNGHRPGRDLLREDQRRSGDMSDLGWCHITQGDAFLRVSFQPQIAGRLSLSSFYYGV